MNITTKYMTNNDCYKQGKTITPKGIMVHSTATPGIMAADWYNRWNKSNVSKCVHAFVDDKGVFQYLPWNYRGWHCGSGSKGSGNDTYVAFEICEPGTFSYGKGSTMIGYDVKENQAYFSAIWNNAVELCVMLCKQFNLTEKDIICHSEGHTMGIASNHGDVMHWFPKHGKTMDDFRKAVGLKLNEGSKPEEPTQEKYVVDNVKNSAYVRSAPGGDIVDTIEKGTVVTVSEIKDEYGKIAAGKWVHMSLLTPIKDEPINNVYIVKSGDSLSKIGKLLGIDWHVIADLNGLKDPYTIYPGQELKIQGEVPKEEYYTVVKGDSLSRIGAKYGIPWKDIAELNNIKDPYVIHIGDKIRIR